MSAAIRQISAHAASGCALARLPLGAMKTASYALMHFTVAIAVAFALTGSWAAALAIGMIEPVVQTVAYTFHEKAWRRAVPQGG